MDVLRSRLASTQLRVLHNQTESYRSWAVETFPHDRLNFHYHKNGYVISWCSIPVVSIFVNECVFFVIFGAYESFTKYHVVNNMYFECSFMSVADPEMAWLKSNLQ